MQLTHLIKSLLPVTLVTSLLSLVLIGKAFAYEPEILFRTDDVIKMELRSDFSKIIGDRTEFQEYQDAELLYNTEDKKPVKLQVMIMPRGNFRRNPDNCSFPPLFINFKKSDVKGTVFENQVKLKLSTTCHHEEDLIEEYLIYRMYNQVTDMSLRVRLARIQYFDTDSKRKLFEKYAFFIEDPENASKRIRSAVVDKSITPEDLDRENFKKMSVFQYMIGNSDWDIPLRKNVFIMQPGGNSERPYVIPYDFDFSVFVSANYTLPKGIKEDMTASRKVYRGLCYASSELAGVFDLYRKLRLSFESLIRKQKALSIDTKDKLLHFINDFYTVIDNDALVKQEFRKPCAL